MPGADAAGADDAADGRANDGAIQIGAGLIDQGARLFDGGQALLAGRAEDAGGALFGDQGSLSFGDRGGGGLGAGLFGLDALLRNPALTLQRRVAIDLGLGEVGLGAGLGDAGDRTFGTR